jgi:hypothetical protein
MTRYTEMWTSLCQCIIHCDRNNGNNDFNSFVVQGSPPKAMKATYMSSVAVTSNLSESLECHNNEKMLRKNWIIKFQLVAIAWFRAGFSLESTSTDKISSCCLATVATLGNRWLLPTCIA